MADRTSTGRAPSKGPPTKKKKKKAAPSNKAPPTKKKKKKKKKKAAPSNKAPPSKTKKAPQKKAASKPRSRRGRRRTARAEAVPTAELALWTPGDRRRMFPRHDLNRPHIRLGLLWFAAIVGSAAVGVFGVAVVYGAAAGIGGLQTAKAWTRAGRAPDRLVAGLAAAALPLSAALFDRGLGLALLIATLATVALSAARGQAKLAEGAVTLRCWFFVGLAAAAPVVVYRIDLSAYIALVILVSAFEAGDYVFGAGSRLPFLGSLVGMAAVGVFSFALFVTPLFVFDGSDIFVFAAVTAVLAPLGQAAASFVLPDGRALASGLRRLDSLLFVGPAWVVLLWSYPWG